MAKEQVGLRLDRATLERVDSARGDVPRNRWIERAVERELGLVEIGRKVAEVERALGEASGAPVEVREAVVDRAAPASPRASGPKSVVREGAPIGELPKIARRHWADD